MLEQLNSTVPSINTVLASIVCAVMDTTSKRPQISGQCYTKHVKQVWTIVIGEAQKRVTPSESHSVLIVSGIAIENCLGGYFLCAVHGD